MWGFVGRNVAEKVEAPERAEEEMSVFSLEELDLFLEKARKDVYEPLWTLAATTGMRRGEVLGLRWQDVDLEKGEIHVRQALVRTVDGKTVISKPKTKAGQRMVVLFPDTIAALKAAKARAAARCLKEGRPWDPSALVCVSRKGTHINPDNLRRQMARLCGSAGVPAIRFHDLRHTHATILLKRKVHPKVVQERLGHASISETMDRYSHLLPSIQRQAMAELWRGAP